MLDLRKNLIERRMVELDSDLAKHYLNFNTYTTQRDIRPLHVKDLAKKMTNGQFRFGEIGFAVMDGIRDILINGQHVCSATVESGETVPCILERFIIKNDRELSEAFRQFEILPRSLTDMVKVEAHSLKISWPLWLSSLIITAATLEKSGQKRLGPPATTATTGGLNYMSKDDKVKLLGRYLKEGDFLSKILCVGGKRKFTRHLQRGAVALIMIKTWRVDPKNSFVFWERVRDGENLTRDMPEMTLREFLVQTRQTVRPSSFAARSVRPHEYAYRCAQAWNAFRTKSKTRLAYYPDNQVPKLK